MVLLEVLVPDGIFYYSLSTLLTGALVWIIGRYVAKQSDLLEYLVKNDVRQDARLDHHDEEIIELKAKK
jgi:hypothetical protein